MSSSPILIFDLDDTIFETRSISRHHVASILEGFQSNIEPYFKGEEISLIMADLWKYPFDRVAEKYNLNDSIKQQFSNAINSLDYQLQIETFSDFSLVRDLKLSKVLVTTGFRKLQIAKIDALDLQHVFQEVHIDEIDAPNRIYKKGIFERLIKTRGKAPQDFMVIGDNPESEIRAGRELELTTVQIAKFGQPKSPMANHYIENFQGLLDILDAH